MRNYGHWANNPINRSFKGDSKVAKMKDTKKRGTPGAFKAQKKEKGE